MSRFTCPQCGRTSFHPKDAEYGYCGACRAFTGGYVTFRLDAGPDTVFAESAAAGLIGTTATIEGHACPVLGATLVDGGRALEATVDVPWEVARRLYPDRHKPVDVPYGYSLTKQVDTGR
jgi:hypothetical protein